MTARELLIVLVMLGDPDYGTYDFLALQSINRLRRNLGLSDKYFWVDAQPRVEPLTTYGEYLAESEVSHPMQFLVHVGCHLQGTVPVTHQPSYVFCHLAGHNHMLPQD